MSTDMTPPYELDWDTFTEHCHTVDDIDVQETNPEKTYITVEGLDDTPPLVVAELFTFAHDCDVHTGSFFADRYGGTVTFYQ